jgi:pilus assembly protein CpaF
VSAGVAELVDDVHRRLVDDGVPDVARVRVEALVRDAAPLLAGPQADAVVDGVLARVRGLGPIDPLLGDPEVCEVMVNGDGRVWIEREGRLERTQVWLGPDAVLHLVERILAPLGRRIDRTSPVVDARLADGSRVHAVVSPVAVDGPCLTVRRFAAKAVPLEAFAEPGVVRLLQRAVHDRRNILVSGGTGAGKTTLLNALAGEIDPRTRVVTVEDAAELRLPGEHVVRLEAQPPTAEGLGEVTIRELVRNALRMRPDRLIVGEVRGAEALDMLQAMNTGHEGSLSTCHANSPADALRRIETMCLFGESRVPLEAVREQVISALDLVVQVARGRGGERRVVEVGAVVRLPDGTPGIEPLVSGDAP